MTTAKHSPLEVVGWVLLVSAMALTSCALGQSNAEPDILQTDNLHNLTPVGGVLRRVLWSFGSILLLIAAVITVLRRRVNPSLYKTATDEHWQEDAREETAMVVEESEVVQACADFGKPKHSVDGVKSTVSEVPSPNHSWLYTPASGPAWTESMLNAFLSSCLKANCLARAWHEEAGCRPQGLPTTRRLLDPREAELIRRLKARWQEFHVDPEEGVFVEHAGNGSGSSRVCLIKVSRDKHAVTWAALNAGFVIESVGRYLRNSDLVHPGAAGYYHAPSRGELAGLSDEGKKQVLPLKNIPDPWRAMIAGFSVQMKPKKALLAWAYRYWASVMYR